MSSKESSIKMTEKVKYKCLCKAIKTKEANSITFSYKWIFSKRASFQVYQDKIKCGRWIIPFDDVESGQILVVGKGFKVLQLSTKKGLHYQFGFNPWADPFKYLPTSYTMSHASVKYSILSMAIRGFLIIYILYFLFGKN